MIIPSPGIENPDLFGSKDRIATFLPFEAGSRIDALLSEVKKIRQATMVGLGLRLKSHFPDFYKKSYVTGTFERFIRLNSSERQVLSNYPPFVAWLREAARLSNQGTTENLALLEWLFFEFGRLLKMGLSEDESKNDRLLIPGTPICVQRFDVDPVLKYIIPPSFEFTKSIPEGQNTVDASPYTLSFFVKAINVALNRISEVSYQAFLDINKLVRIIIHLNKAKFRSCSADRYVGVILMSAQDYSILEMEESLLHEFGHQILYNIMEVDPLLENPHSKKTFSLPWSGSIRDLYGYFHAFYIYLLLAMYYTRISGRPQQEQEHCRYRLKEIHTGLIQALPDFRAADFTPVGKRFLYSLSRHVQELDDMHTFSEAGGNNFSRVKEVL